MALIFLFNSASSSAMYSGAVGYSSCTGRATKGRDDALTAAPKRRCDRCQVLPTLRLFGHALTGLAAKHGAEGGSAEIVTEATALPESRSTHAPANGSASSSMPLIAREKTSETAWSVWKTHDSA